MSRLILALLLALLLTSPGHAASDIAPTGGDTETPSWFAQSFLEFDSEVRDAGKAGKRVLVYFTQAGCPYCRELVQTSFSQEDIVTFTQKHYIPIALDIWGDREVTWMDGVKVTEKALAQRLKVQFTPTILLLDEKGNVAARLNGYYPPHRFRAALRYGAERLEGKTDFVAYLRANAALAARPSLTEEPFFIKTPYDLRPGKSAKPLMVVFEYKDCSSCDGLHDQGFTNSAVRSELPRFDVVRFNLFGREKIRLHDGIELSEAAYARQLRIAYAPTLVLFDAGHKEALRIESDIKAAHLLGAMRYVSTGAHVSEPNFQSYIRDHFADLQKAVRAVAP